MPVPISEKQLVTVAGKYKLPWPPPRDLEEIKRMYRAAMLKHHPDKGGSAEAAQEINLWHDCARGLLDGTLRPVQRRPIVPPGWARPISVTQPVTGGTFSVSFGGASTNAATSAGFPFGGGVVIIFRRG